MSYKALYRVFRPKTFSEVVGQEHIVSVLKSQVESGQVSHAYLFTGSRGTGKTSIAKIFARAISCPNSSDGEACMTCQLCQDTLNESSIDIVEIDAASNNGVDEIRELRENVKYAPVTGKYKVYIVDEVHMLSGGAFNALLKTLEEPPAHAVFILATTEPQKLPETIVSRCQRYDFEKIDREAIAARLEFICGEVKASAEKEALYLIADHAKGGLRDAISLLDQCIVFGDGNVTQEGVLELLGKSEDEQLFKIAGMLINSDTPSLIELVNTLAKSGHSVSVLTGDIIEHLHRLMVFKTAKNPSAIIDTTRAEDYLAQAEEAGIHILLRGIKILSEAMNSMRYAFSPLVILEVALVEVCIQEVDSDNIALLARIEAVEKAVRSGSLTKSTNDVSVRKESPVAKPQDVPLQDDKFASSLDDIDVPFAQEAPPLEMPESSFFDEDILKESRVDEPSAAVKAVHKKTEEKHEEEYSAAVNTGEFTDRDYDEFLKKMNKANKGVYISLKDSFFAGIEDNVFTIGYPSDDCHVFVKAVEAKSDIILNVLEQMGFKDLKVCAKIVKQDKTEDLKKIFGEDITFID